MRNRAEAVNAMGLECGDAAKQYYRTIDDHGSLIIVFRFGKLLPVPLEVVDSYNKILEIWSSLGSDIGILKTFGGNLILHPPHSKEFNPEITAAEIENCKLYSTHMYPERFIAGYWLNSQHGRHGFSVKMVLRGT